MTGEEQAGTTQSTDKRSEDDGGASNVMPTARSGAHRNTQLHEMWTRWMRAALALLQSKPLVIAPDYDVVLTAIGHTATLGPNRPDLRQTVDAYAGDLAGLIELSELAQLILGTPMLHAGLQPTDTPAFSDPQAQLSALWRVCRVFLLEYVTVANDNALGFEEARFERVYAQLEAYLFQPGPFPCEWLLHLSNLSLEPNRVDVEAGLALRQMSPDDRVWLGAIS